MFEQLKETYIDRTAQQSEMLETLSRPDFGMIAEIAQGEEITMTDEIMTRLANEAKQRLTSMRIRCFMENEGVAK